MRRKCIQLAGKTLVISLPSVWVREQGVKKGQELEVSLAGRALVVEVVGSGSMSSVIVDVSGLNASLVWHAIVAQYVNGCAQMEVRFKDALVVDPRTGAKISPAESIERAVEGLIGMEIVRQSRNAVTIREISSVAPDEYPNVMRRVWLTCLSMAEDGRDALVAGDCKGFSAALRVEKNVNRFVLYALRMLNRGVAADVRSALGDARVLHALEWFADSLCALDGKGDAASGLKDADKARMLSSMADVVRLSYDCWFNPSSRALEGAYAALMAARALRISAPSLVAAVEILVEAVAAKVVSGQKAP